jgi:hypothetical protein
MKRALMLALLLLHPASSNLTVAQTPDTKVIDNFISRQAAKYKAEEYADARKVLSGDLNHDGLADTVVLYTIEGQGGSNNYIQYLAVFLGRNNALVYATHRAVGGKNRRDIELVSITDGAINLKTMDYGPRDPSCCPTIKGSASYSFSNGALVEKHHKTKSP